jgi:hypothetical protein
MENGTASATDLRSVVEQAAREDAPVTTVVVALETLAYWCHGRGKPLQSRVVDAADRELFLTSGALTELLELVLSRCPLAAFGTRERAALSVASIFRFGPAGQVVLAVDRALRRVQRLASDPVVREQRAKWIAFELFEKHFVRVPGCLLGALAGVRYRATEPRCLTVDREADPDTVLRSLLAMPDIVTNVLQCALPETCTLHPQRYPHCLAWTVTEWLLTLCSSQYASMGVEKQQLTWLTNEALASNVVAEVSGSLSALDLHEDDTTYGSAVMLSMPSPQDAYAFGSSALETLMDMAGRLGRHLCRRRCITAWCQVAIRALIALERQLSASQADYWKRCCMESFTALPDRYIAPLMEQFAILGCKGPDQHQVAAIAYLEYLCRTRDTAVAFVSKTLPSSMPKATSMLSPLAAPGDQRILLFLLRSCRDVVETSHWRTALTLALKRWMQTARTAALWAEDLHITRMLLFLAQASCSGDPEHSCPRTESCESYGVDWFVLLGEGVKEHLAGALPETHFHGMIVGETVSRIWDPPGKSMQFDIAAYEAWKASDPELLQPWIEATKEPLLAQHQQHQHPVDGGVATGTPPSEGTSLCAPSTHAVATVGVRSPAVADENDNDDLKPYPMPADELAIDPHSEPREDGTGSCAQETLGLPQTFETLYRALAAEVRHEPFGAEAAFRGPSSTTPQDSTPTSTSIPTQRVLCQLEQLIERDVAGLEYWAMPMLQLLHRLGTGSSSTSIARDCAALCRTIAVHAFSSIAVPVAKLVFSQNMTLTERSEWLEILANSVETLLNTQYTARKPTQRGAAEATSPTPEGHQDHQICSRVRRVSVRSLHQTKARQSESFAMSQRAVFTAAAGACDASGQTSLHTQPALHFHAMVQAFFELLAGADTEEPWLDLWRRDQMLLAQLVQTCALVLHCAQGPGSLCIGAVTRLASMGQALAQLAYTARTCSDAAVHRACVLAFNAVYEILLRIREAYGIQSFRQLEHWWRSNQSSSNVSLEHIAQLLERWSSDAQDSATRELAQALLPCFHDDGRAQRIA